jgi:hypothetical protein
VALAYAMLRLVVSRAPVDLPRIHEVAVDGRVLVLAVLATLVTTPLVGLLPAWRSTHSEVCVTSTTISLPRPGPLYAPTSCDAS